MDPLEPIPETVEAVNDLDPYAEGGDLLARLRRLTGRARGVVPDLVGVSIARVDHGLTFTLVASAGEPAVLDGVQYLAGGPCVDGARSDEVTEFDSESALDEERWRLFAEATAAHAVRSTLTLPVLEDEVVVGTVNLYAASRRAFVGHHDDLAAVFGAWAAGAVADADLSFATRDEAREAPRRVQDQNSVDVAIGVVAAQLDLDVVAAEARLRDAAARAGVSAAELARSILYLRESRRDDR